MSEEEAETGSVSEQTYGRLLSLIEAGELPPGRILEERALAKRLSVSRTPMRIALSRMLGEGMVHRLSNGTLTVREIGLMDYLQLIQFRQMIEGEAAFLAARKIPLGQLRSLAGDIEQMAQSSTPDLRRHWEIDDRVHALIAESCGNRWLAEAISNARRMVRMCNVEKLPERFHETCREHLAILHALEKGDGEAARERMRDHIDQVRKGFMNLLSAG